MDKHKLIWSVRSFSDLDRAHALLAKHSFEAANDTIDHIITRAAQLLEFPKSGPIEQSLLHRKKEHRYLVCGHHKLIYRIEKRTILIVRVFDTRQRPSKLK